MDIEYLPSGYAGFLRFSNHFQVGAHVRCTGCELQGQGYSGLQALETPQPQRGTFCSYQLPRGAHGSRTWVSLRCECK